MTENDRFDIFIAYYGNENTGSERYARELYEYLKEHEIYPGRKIRPYFHPITRPYGKFEETPVVVAATPMFVLVVDKRILNVFDGQITRYRRDGAFSYLYDEVSSFHNSTMYKLPGGDQASRLLIVDDFNFVKAASLHPIFGGKTALTRNEEVADWVKHFYNNAYVQRQYLKYKALASVNKDDFVKGTWVPEALTLFENTGDESIGRSLIIYYAMRYDAGDDSALVGMRRITDNLSRRYNNGEKISDNTKKLLYKVVEEYL